MFKLDVASNSILEHSEYRIQFNTLFFASLANQPCQESEPENARVPVAMVPAPKQQPTQTVEGPPPTTPVPAVTKTSTNEVPTPETLSH